MLAASRSVPAKVARVQREEQKATGVQAAKRKLVGGQLLFHNRRVRTLSPIVDGLGQQQ